MAKPTIEFYAVPYEVNGHTGYRPQIENQDGVYDMDFCKEVVTEKRLAMSADELLHAMEMVGEVGPAKVAADGRPRGITKLLKYNLFSQGNLESPTSPWNETCRAYVRPQLMSAATKEIDANFVNVSSGIGVKLNYVAWLGAQSVINVVKVGKSFAAYGNHMEWLAGDTAKLIVGTQSYNLACTESDVAHAVFGWPSGLNPEAGTQATFVMLSRGGVEEGEVYTSKKTVTIIAGDPVPALTTIQQGNRAAGQASFGQGETYAIAINGTIPGGLKESDTLTLSLLDTDGTVLTSMNAKTYVTASDATALHLGNGIDNDSEKPDGDWVGKQAKYTLTRDGVEYPLTYSHVATT